MSLFFLIFVIVVCIALAIYVVKKLPLKISKIVSIFLWLIIVFFCFKLWGSISDPIKFNKEKKVAYADVIKKLKLIRAAELAHRDIEGRYISNYDSLITFIESAKFTIVQQRDSSYEYFDKGYRISKIKEVVIIDTLGFVAVKDSLFKNGSYMDMMKVGDNKIELSSGYIEKLGRKIPVFEAFIKKADILKGQDPILISQELQVLGGDEIRGDRISVGSMEEVNSNGNWPPLFDTKEEIKKSK